MKQLYMITEIRRGSCESYSLKMDTEELKRYLRNKRETYGYIPGVGGDKSYECFAVLWN